MSWHERLFGNLMLTLLAGVFGWAILGGVYDMFLADDLELLGHHGRGGAYTDVDMPY